MTETIGYCRDCGQSVEGKLVFLETQEGCTPQYIKGAPPPGALLRCDICEYNHRGEHADELLLNEDDIARVDSDDRLVRAKELLWRHLKAGPVGLTEELDIAERLPVDWDSTNEIRLVFGTAYTQAEERHRVVVERVVLSVLPWAPLLTAAVLFGGPVWIPFIIYTIGGVMAWPLALARAKTYSDIKESALYVPHSLEVDRLMAEEGVWDDDVVEHFPILTRWTRAKTASTLTGARDRSTIREELAGLTPQEFEKELAVLFGRFEHDVEITRHSRDRGIDLLMEDSEGTRYVVQVKQFASGLSVGRPTLQRLQGAMLDSKAEKAMVVTLSDFSEPAKLYARKHGIRLVDGDELVDMMMEGETERPA